MTSPIPKEERFKKDKIIKSKIGLNNAGESCYMASIIQILIHLEKFLDSLEKNYTKNKLYLTFFNEFISDLNKNILSLFEGKKEVKLIRNNENKKPIDTTEENFIFYLITLDNNNEDIKYYFGNNLNSPKEFENEKDEQIIEQITKFPEILVINLELEIDNYKPEEKIWIQKGEKDFVGYNLKAINKYSDAHSIA